MKIAMLGHKRIPSREGGVEIVVEKLATGMVRAGHDVTCYNRRGDHVCGKEFGKAALKEFQGVRLISVPTVRAKGLAAASASFFASVRAAFGNYDAVHFHAEGPCATLWLPRLTGKRCVVTIHGIDWRRAKWGRFASWYIRLGERVAARYADEIVVLSQDNQKYFRDVYGRETTLLPNGVEKPEPREAKLIRETFGLEKDGYVLFLSRLVPEKGLEYLLEAFRDVKTEKKLVVAGGSSDTGEYVQRLKRLAQDDERVIFTGFVEGEMLEELYSNAYLYTLPSDLEGMPLSLLEAMSYGNCCLVSDIPELTELVGDGAAIFQRGNVEDLREKLTQACDHPEQVRALKACAAEKALEGRSWESVVEKTLELYRKKA